MTFHIDAIYDDGVLKPLMPLALPEKSRVKLTIESDATTEVQSDVLAQQQAALLELWTEIDRLPQHKNNDGWSVRQHDELLYDRLQ